MPKSETRIMQKSLLCWPAQEEERKRHTALKAGYRAMAADRAREIKARQWCEALIRDAADQAIVTDPDLIFSKSRHVQ